MERVEKFLAEAAECIGRKDSSALFELLSGHQDLALDALEIVRLFASLNHIDVRAVAARGLPVFGVSGTGGASLRRPNISTLTAIYMAATGKVLSVKTGSRSHRGMVGSTECLEQLGYVSSPDSGFLYFDVDESVPWKNFSSVLKLNASIRGFLEKHAVHDVPYSWKLTGLPDRAAVDAYSARRHLPEGVKVLAYTGLLLGQPVDEILPSEVYANDCGRTVVLDFTCDAGPDIPGSNEEVLALNRSLLAGKCPSRFWTRTLELSVAVALTFTGLSASQEEGERLFRGLYDGGRAKEVLGKD